MTHNPGTQPQIVNLGRTISGKPGLFTGGCLAWPLDEDDFAFYSRNTEALRTYARRLGFDLADPDEEARVNAMLLAWERDQRAIAAACDYL